MGKRGGSSGILTCNPCDLKTKRGPPLRAVLDGRLAKNLLATNCPLNSMGGSMLSRERYMCLSQQTACQFVSQRHSTSNKLHAPSSKERSHGFLVVLLRHPLGGLKKKYPPCYEAVFDKFCPFPCTRTLPQSVTRSIKFDALAQLASRLGRNSEIREIRQPQCRPNSGAPPRSPRSAPCERRTFPSAHVAL